MIEPVDTLGDVEIPRKVWTREEAHALAELGLPWIEKLELIDGELIDRMGKKRSHVIWQTLVQEWLRGVFGPGRVESEAPMDVAKEDNTHSEPEPDLKVLRRSTREYVENPPPEDILLVVEISDSRVRFDLQAKGKLYARAGIIEYWVVDIPDRQLIVHREPQEGRYARVMQLEWNESVCPMAAPEAVFCLDRL